MDEVNDENADVRPVLSARSVSWFEFLLNPAFLEEHLSNENAEPSATDLIIQFLANATLQKDREQMTFPPVTVLPADKSESGDSPEAEAKDNGGDSKKSVALKLLALKVAAFLKWDLNILQAKLPIPMQNTLLLHLLSVALEGDDVMDTKSHAECDLSSLTNQAFFAVVLFHRWCARMISPEAVCAKPSKSMAVALPGSQDPTFVPPAVVETLIKSVYDKIEDTIVVLDKSLSLMQDVRIPSLHSFGTLCEDKQDVEFFWERGVLVDKKEIACQTAFDLGCLHFFRHEYSPAGKAIFKAVELFEQILSFEFCGVDKGVLQGYCVALQGLLGKSTESQKKTLLERLNMAIHCNVDDIIPVLMDDNVKRDIRLSFREETLSNLHMLRSKLSPAAFSELHFKVLALNVLRTVLDGRAFYHEFVKALISKGESGAQFLHDAILHVVPEMSQVQRENMKNFIRYVCGVTVGIMPEVSKILNSAGILGTVIDLKRSDDPHLFKGGLAGDQMQRDFTGRPSLQLGELEIQLQTTYEPRLIYDLIPRIHAFGRRTPAWMITKRWELQNPVHALLMELPQGYTQEAIYIMWAKARELARVKSYVKASRLLEVVDREASDTSFKLLRLVRWERLFMDLLHVRSLIGVQPPDEAWVQELAKQAKHCLTISIQEKGSEIAPCQELIEECAVFLLNCQQCEYLATLELTGRNCLEFSCILSRTCGEVQGNKGGRKAVRELWDAVLPMFAMSMGQHKRGLTGIPSLVARETPYVLLPRHEFHRFIEKLKDRNMLSIFISLLSKIHNILKDDTNLNVSIDSSITWPTVISNCSMFSIRLVQESLLMLLNHTLSIYSMSVVWIKAKADLNYVLGHHASALKFYMEAAMVSSGHFADPISRFVLDETSLRRMIRCCSQLQCHTQAAILCQFLDEVDYATAFKALQEKNSQDAMDVYYPCIWDVNVLEFLVYIHSKRGEVSKKEFALRLIGQLELNSNNNEEIQREASNLRKSRFMRAMVRQYL